MKRTQFFRLATLALILGMVVGPYVMPTRAQSNQIVSTAAGTITTSKPFIGAQTWNAGGVSFMGLQLNITETASAAGSHYLDINGGVAGATSAFFVAKGGAFTAAGAFTGTTETLAGGVLTTSLPNALTQTWNAGGVTFAGLTLTYTETAAAVASTYINILGGAAGSTAEWSVILGGKTAQAGQAAIAATTNQLLLGTTNTTTLNFGAPAASTVLTGPNIGPSNAASIPTSFNCGSTGSGNQTCSPTAAGGAYHTISGQSTLSGNNAIITFPAGMVFTSTTSFACAATDQTTVTNPVKAVPSAANTMTLTDTTGATDVIGWVCSGT